MALNMQWISFEEGNTVTKPPNLNGVNYSFWKNRMTIFIKSQDIELWKVIVKRPKIPKREDGMTKNEIDYDDGMTKREDSKTWRWHALRKSTKHPVEKVTWVALSITPVKHMFQKI